MASRRAASLFVMSGLTLWLAAPALSGELPRYTPVGAQVRPPIGWTQFCLENPTDCASAPSIPRDIVLTPQAWKHLHAVNDWVNQNVKPVTDLEHWGVVEKWSYPTDGYGDCEEYVLLKRKMLIDNGWPREALLITVVRDKNDEGHAVLTVKTDRGEFILDNENEEIVPWMETGYRFVKRQTQSDQNVWVAVGPTANAHATATAR